MLSFRFYPNAAQPRFLDIDSNNNTIIHMELQMCTTLHINKTRIFLNICELKSIVLQDIFSKQELI